MATQNEPNQDNEEEIPQLITIGPSIFVPTDRDFTKTPPPLSDDPVSRLETTLEAVDWHAARVEKNMIWMLEREAERVRRKGQIERVLYDSYQRPIKETQRRTGHELRLEQMILRQDERAVLRILGHEEDPRERRHPHQSPRPRGHQDPEYADLLTLRRDKMFRADPDELRQPSRSVALTHVLNLVKWGWDDQVDGHKHIVQKNKVDSRANLHRLMKENPVPPATTGSAAPTQPASAPVIAHETNIPGRNSPGRKSPGRKSSIDILDPMDIDE
ncbi:hypothetical protein F5X98DRAFT_232271 [Xylaria grammica]|nr:hypothetical protein F5X98DRAFT_232271 [Xylaria grammica]